MTSPAGRWSERAAALGAAAALICAALGLAACPEDEQACIPGESRQCACPDGSNGRQVCADDGRSLGECECSAAAAGDGGAATKADGAAAAAPA